LFVALHKWRDQRAKVVDEPPEIIVKTPELAEICKTGPRRLDDFKSMFPAIPLFLQGVEHELVNICKSAAVKKRKLDTTQDDLIIDAPKDPIPLPSVKRKKWSGRAPNIVTNPQENLRYQRRRRKWNHRQNLKTRRTNLT